jgi:prepilin-type N-terminal cleavage/methylation domain-containing protein
VNLRDTVVMGVARARRGAQAGFTLVEMAIVLVIVGLLVGGILKGQEIVNNGRVKTQVAQIDSIKAAVETFVDKYGYYPGDDPQASTQLGIDTSFNGRGDGFVSTAVGVADADTLGEAASTPPNAVWYELQAANLLPGVISSFPGGNQVNGLSYNIEGKIASSYLTYADFTVNLAAGAVTNKMVRIQGVLNPSVPTPVMREADASQIDTKYDDGIPSSGQIMATDYSLQACCKNASCQAQGAQYGLLTGANSAGNYCALIWVAQ